MHLKKITFKWKGSLSFYIKNRLYYFSKNKIYFTISTLFSNKSSNFKEKKIMLIQYGIIKFCLYSNQSIFTIDISKNKNYEIKP